MRLRARNVSFSRLSNHRAVLIKKTGLITKINPVRHVGAPKESAPFG
jgi:hypothetical protein